MSTLKPPVGPQDHAQGPANAPVTLTEFGDFECPHCGLAYFIVKTIQDELGDNLRFVFRHFPLTQVHPHALLAAHAAEAADKQDHFWEMHDLLFEHQQKLGQVNLGLYAERCGLDLVRFFTDLESPEVAARVKADFLSGARSGVNGTPTFFINGERYDGSWKADDFLLALRSLL
jgi:protein-disulfide isomerase